jgi:molecular chaperone DnaK (HSP70)
MSAQFVIGIDLGTTNSVLAYSALNEAQADVQLLPIPQLVAANTIESRSMLPSFLYQCTSDESAARSFALPWNTDVTFTAGHGARSLSAEFPDRTVGAAKSWLGHSKIDRHQPLLPWHASDDVAKISPVTASQRYLEHLVAAWHQAFPDAPFAAQNVVLTVPASFDASARELTREAALTAGLPPTFVLLEEPQAATYAWLNAVGDRWRKLLKVGDRM